MSELKKVFLVFLLFSLFILSTCAVIPVSVEAEMALQKKAHMYFNPDESRCRP